VCREKVGVVSAESAVPAHRVIDAEALEGSCRRGPVGQNSACLEACTYLVEVNMLLAVALPLSMLVVECEK
jgi:hypothetical protein